MLRSSGISRAQAAAQRVAPLLAGEWYGTPCWSAVSSTPVVANTMYATPWLPTEDMLIDRIGLRIATGAAGDAKVGLYSMGADKLPAAVLAENTADLTTAATAFLTGTIAATQVRVGVPVFIVAAFSGTPTPMTFNGQTVQSGGFVAALGAPNGSENVWLNNGFMSRYTRALTYVSGSAFFPATFGAATIGTGNPGGMVFSVRKAV